MINRKVKTSSMLVVTSAKYGAGTINPICLQNWNRRWKKGKKEGRNPFHAFSHIGYVVLALLLFNVIGT